MKEISLSLFNTGERFLLLQLMVNLLEDKLEKLPELKPVYNRLLTLRNQLEAALNKNRGSDHTDVLSALDETQDNGFLCFRNGVSAQKYSIIDESLRAKAEYIEAIIRRHHWSLMQLGYQKQLSLSHSLIAELKAETNQQRIADLGQTANFKAWGGAVDAFSTGFTKKIEEDAGDSDKAAYQLGKEANELIGQLLPGWSYQAEFGNVTAYKELLEQVTKGAAEIEEQARARKTRRENKATVKQ